MSHHHHSHHPHADGHEDGVMHEEDHEIHDITPDHDGVHHHHAWAGHHLYCPSEDDCTRDLVNVGLGVYFRVAERNNVETQPVAVWPYMTRGDWKSMAEHGAFLIPAYIALRNL